MPFGVALSNIFFAVASTWHFILLGLRSRTSSSSINSPLRSAGGSHARRETGDRLLHGHAHQQPRGYIYEYISPALPFLLCVLVTVPCALLTLFLIHEPEKRQS